MARRPGNQSDAVSLWKQEIERRLRALESNPPGGFSADGTKTYLRSGRDLEVTGGDIIVDGGQVLFLDGSGNTLFTIDANGLITFEADGSQMSVLDAGKLKFNRSDGTRQLEITPGGGLKFYKTDGTSVITTLDGTGLTVDTGGDGVTIGGVTLEARTFEPRTATGSNDSLSTTATETASIVHVPPSGYTDLIVLVVASVMMTNSSGGLQGVTISLERDGSPVGFTGRADVPNGGVAQAVTFVPTPLEITGNVEITAHVATSTGVNSVNTTNLMCLFIPSVSSAGGGPA